MENLKFYGLSFLFALRYFVGFYYINHKIPMTKT